MNATKFAEFLTSKKLDARRLLIVSHELETLHRSDRDIKLGQRRAKAGDAASPPAADAPKVEKVKPRSGRPLTPRSLNAAMSGGTLSGPIKTRFLKAINHILEQKKQPKVELKTLF